MTPLRVMLIIALVFLALGYSTKAACLQTTGTGTADQRVGNWQNQRAYYELCYSDTVPLYTAELLNLGKFPYKSSWIETDGAGSPADPVRRRAGRAVHGISGADRASTSTCRWRWPRPTPR